MENAQLHATWEEILKKLENSLSKMVCDTWLKPIKPIVLTTTSLELGTPTDFSKDWIEKHYMQLILDASYEVTKAKLDIILTSVT